MDSVRTAPLVLRAGLFAGLAGGVAIAVYLLAEAALTGGLSGGIAGFFQYVAATGTGVPRSEMQHASPFVGVLLHFGVSIGWGIAYAYLAQQQQQLVRRPFVSGLAFGLVVWFFMQVVLAVSNAAVPPTPGTVVNALIAHCVFFGLPVAYVVDAVFRRAA